jgi:hypothetical protein
MSEAISGDDAIAIVAAVTAGHHPERVTHSELEMFMTWCRQTRTRQALLDLAIAGQVVTQWSPEQDDWLFLSTKHLSHEASEWLKAVHEGLLQ